MLLQFSVENFLSFRGRTTLSMMAAPGVKHRPEHVISLPDGRQVLRCAALYGANASGKSNMVKAVEFACKFLEDGTTKPDSPIAVVPFRLSPETARKPSSFEFVFTDGDRIFSYGFVVDTRSVHEEWLHELTRPEAPVIFERDKDQSPSITLPEHPTIAPKRRDFFRFLAESTRENQLFLTEASLRKGEELGRYGEHLLRLVGILSSTVRDVLLHWLTQDTELLPFAERILSEAGTGIARIDIEKKIHKEVLPLDFVKYAKNPDYVVVDWDEKERVLSVARTILRHHGQSVEQPGFTLSEESDGTRELLRLSPIIVMAELATELGESPSEKHHSVAFIADELERSLHPLLSRYLIREFLKRGAGGRSQLIFTTHDTDLLDLRLLSRDGIWFAEKNHEGASVLYSLAEFKGEQIDKLGESLEDDYLKGRFGAIPFHGDLQKLGWLDDPEGEG